MIKNWFWNYSSLKRPLKKKNADQIYKIWDELDVTTMRKRAGEHDFKKTFDGSDPTDDDLYIQRSENLKRFSMPKFRWWRLKHHNKTLVQYVRSTETLKQQMKKRRLI